MNTIRYREHLGLTVFTAVVMCLFLYSHADAVPSPPSAKEQLKTYLLDTYPWEEIEVSNVKVIGNLREEPPQKIITEKGPLGGAAFWFVYGHNEKVAVRADVRAFGPVVKTRRSVRRNHVINENDIYSAKMDIRKMPGGAVQDPEAILGKPLKRSIAANRPILENMIQLTQVVPRGKRVVLLLIQDGLSIRAAGKMKEKGVVGGPARAVNLSSKKEVNGVLIDGETVKVQL